MPFRRAIKRLPTLHESQQAENLQACAATIANSYRSRLRVHESTAGILQILQDMIITLPRYFHLWEGAAQPEREGLIGVRLSYWKKLDASAADM